MKAAALLALLAALPAQAGDAVTPAQARANVVQALPPGIREGAKTGDLSAYLGRLTPEQKQAALRSLTEKKDELGDDPKTQSLIGEAYVALGKVKEARQIAQAAMDRNANDPDARRLMALVVTQEKLNRPDAVGGAFGDTRGPGGGGQSPAAAGRQDPLNALEQRIARAFQRGQRSAEFKDTMEDARGLSVAELKAVGIEFQRADANQQDAVTIARTQEGGFRISIREDALASGGDTEARAAAHVANGVRQAQTLRDHEYIGRALIIARGWISGARTHRELAPTDVETRPTTPSDQGLMAARKIADRENYHFDPSAESYGGGLATMAMGQLNARTKDTKLSLEDLFAYFLRSTGRAPSN